MCSYPPPLPREKKLHRDLGSAESRARSSLASHYSSAGAQPGRDEAGSLPVIVPGGSELPTLTAAFHFQNINISSLSFLID